ncbi:MAG: hypothetical protein KGH58_03005 [Candidatus Micrarchaeota archaeon]|nr:hypothetical protein [Candidatus Micrarchaeota archaeon]
MSKRSQGLFVGKTRHLARHHKPSSLGINEIIKDIKVGENVAIVPKGNFKNIPHPRYKGRIGRVMEKRGAAYVVKLKMLNSTVQLIVPGIHLQKMGAPAIKKTA